MKALHNNTIESRNERPIKVLQFGKGNFLRGFATWLVNKWNDEADFNGNIHIVETFDTRRSQLLRQQDFLYHVIEQGISNGNEITRLHLVDCVSGLTNSSNSYKSYLELGLLSELQFIISNTTEAGIQFEENDSDLTSPQTFPAKLTALLYHRFKHLGETADRLYVLPCELIDKNGDALRVAIRKYCSLWALSEAFTIWLATHISFCNTLVDRIVTGFPKNNLRFQEHLGYEDTMMVVTEPFYLWVMEEQGELAQVLPMHDKFTMNNPLFDSGIKLVKDNSPFKQIKVKLLNGAHTSMVALGLLQSISTVREFMENEKLCSFLKAMLNEEILPSLPQQQSLKENFKNSMFDRFLNPFLEHQLKDIQLNSFSKFKSRLLPSISEYAEHKGKAPEKLSKVFAGLIALYYYNFLKNNSLNDEETIEDTLKHIFNSTFKNHIVEKVLSEKTFWGMDLTKLPGLVDKVTYFFLEAMQKQTMD